MSLGVIGWCKLLRAVPNAVKTVSASPHGSPTTCASRKGLGFPIIPTFWWLRIQRCLWCRIWRCLLSQNPGPLSWLTPNTVLLSQPHWISYSAGVTQSVLRKALILTLIEHRPWQRKRWADCNFVVIANAFCILQQSFEGSCWGGSE